MYFSRLKELINKITTSQEEYAITYGKSETIKSGIYKRKERIKNLDIELQNWISLKSNSEKMMMDLNKRKAQLEKEIDQNQKNP